MFSYYILVSAYAEITPRTRIGKQGICSVEVISYMPSSHLQYSSDLMGPGDIVAILGFVFWEIFLYFGLKILTRLPV